MLEIVTSLEQYKAIRNALIKEQKKIGFVPTMGNLHAGHASLLERSIAENEVTVLSIFVNPTQFNQQEDFINYPKTIERDVALAKELGVDYLLLPTVEDLYPDDYRFKITENALSKILEGEHRPGHFDGVLTVVMKLLMLVKPQRAYFGEKDYQQYQLIKDMAQAFFLDTEVIACKTIRNDSGLAHSSRNNRLSEDELLSACKFPEILLKYSAPDDASKALSDQGFSVEYVEDYDNRRYAAIKIGSIRLIDNFALSDKED